ncbi:hypothetical protein AWRI1631_46090, partial [Saccharomyces cerevisiae AWRI1631]
MFRVLSSAIFSLFKVTILASRSSSSISSLSSLFSKGCSLNINCNSHGSLIWDFLTFIMFPPSFSSFSPPPAFFKSSSPPAPGFPVPLATPALASWSLAFLRKSFHDRYVLKRLTLALSCLIKKMTSS